MDVGLARMISLVFETKRMEVVPHDLPQRTPPPLRKPHFVEASLVVPAVTLAELPETLQDTHELVSAFYRWESRHHGCVYKVIFTWAARGSDVRPCEVPSDVKQRALEELCVPTWDIKGFVNPFTLEGQVVDGATSLSVLAKGRRLDLPAECRKLRVEAGCLAVI